MSHPKPPHAGVTPEEMASLRKAARRSAGRSSDPEIVSFSDGREAAAYHAEPVAPPAAVDQTVSNGDVLLSSTLRREVALAEEKPPQVVAEVAPEAPESSRRLEETLRAPSSSPPARAGRPWIPIALVALGAVALVSTVALVAGRSSGPVPAASSAATDRPAPSPAVVATVAPAVVPTVAPSESAAPAMPSAASAAPSPPPPERPHRGTRRPSPTPASSSKGSDGMIVPPL
jgi:hypothetical protein